jgi:16S rRNA (adenine1518-N6/adenine1519-N6)-dimethyltransferase
MKPKKKLGQHWLHDESSLASMADIAKVGEGDVVLEIGPGLGTLTKVLLERAAKVVAVEYDSGLYEHLKGEFTESDDLQFVHEDILRFDLTQLAPDYKVVANIPYYLTSNLVRVLSESTNPPRSVTLLIQKEVAERLAAGPGEMSLLSVTAQMHFEPKLGLVIPAELFTPPPKVDSQIIHLHRRSKPIYGQADPKLLFRLVKAGFSNRRKTLLNSLSGGLQLSKPDTKDLLEKAGINPQTRAQDLSLEDWINLNKLQD